MHSTLSFPRSLVNANLPLRSTTLFQSSYPSPEESAEAFTKYMIKASDEKMRAVKSAEDKSKAEIAALQAKVAEVREGGVSGFGTQLGLCGDYEKLVVNRDLVFLLTQNIVVIAHALTLSISQ